MENSAAKLRQYFKTQMGKSHQIENHPLNQADEYTRDYYLTMLCVASQSKGELEGGQALFIQRILGGIKEAKDFREYIKRAYEVDIKFAEEFVNLFKDNPLKYNLIVDALIIAHLNHDEFQNTLFIAELSDTLGITNDEMIAMAKLTSGILSENSEQYLEGSKLLASKFDYQKFWYYGKNFVAGCIQNDDEVTYYYSLNKRPFTFESSEIEFKSKKIEIKSKTVIFENLIVDLSETLLKLESCEYISFRNCEFTGKYIEINSTKNLEIVDSVFKNFNDGAFFISGLDKLAIVDSVFKNVSRVGFITNLNKLEIINSKFYNINCTGNYSSSSGKGGVFYFNEIKELEIQIKESEFKNCYAESYCSILYCFKTSLSSNTQIVNSKFYNCKSQYGTQIEGSKKEMYIDCEIVDCGKMY